MLTPSWLLLAARFRIPDDMMPSIKISWAPSEMDGAHLAEDGTGAPAASGKRRVPGGLIISALSGQWALQTHPFKRNV